LGLYNHLVQSLFSKQLYGGYVYLGEGQDLGQFWAKLAVGNATIKRSSANANISKDDLYSHAGAKYTIYSDKGLTKEVDTLTTDSQGNTDTIEDVALVLEENFTVKEVTKQLDVH
jgi:hypothetical protein